MKIALIQSNPTIGDIEGNTERVLNGLSRAAERGAQLAVFPEQTIIGYPAKDLLPPARSHRAQRSRARAHRRPNRPHRRCSRYVERNTQPFGGPSTTQPHSVTAGASSPAGASGCCPRMTVRRSALLRARRTASRRRIRRRAARGDHLRRHVVARGDARPAALRVRPDRGSRAGRSAGDPQHLRVTLLPG